MIAPRLPDAPIHALLHNDPLAIVGHNEAVQIEIEAVLNGGALYLWRPPARLCQPSAVEPAPLADGDELVRGLPRIFATAAADVNAQFVCERRQPALQCADDAGRDAR